MQRIVLKISGEALSGDTGIGINYDKVKEIATEIKELHDKGNIELSIIVGAGNICRGREAIKTGMNRVNADYMGMLATVINAMALQGALEGLGKKAVVMTAIPMQVVTDYYTRRDAVKKLEEGNIVIFGNQPKPFICTFFHTSVCATQTSTSLIVYSHILQRRKFLIFGFTLTRLSVPPEYFLGSIPNRAINGLLPRPFRYCGTD